MKRVSSLDPGARLLDVCPHGAGKGPLNLDRKGARRMLQLDEAQCLNTSPAPWDVVGVTCRVTVQLYSATPIKSDEACIRSNYNSYPP